MEAEQVAQALSHELMSPYCPGRTISSCPSPNARKLEAFILEEAAAGKSKAEIEAGLVETFGREKLGSVTSPPVYWTVGLASILAAAWIVRAIRRWRATPAAAVVGAEVETGPRLDPESLDRLEEALDEIEEF